MWYRLGADVLLLVHFLWIVFLILGLPLGLYFKLHRLRILHAMGLILALVLQFNHLLCPLTIWEEYFRSSQYPGFSYRGSFIITYVEKLVYPGWISMNTITIITALLAGFTLISFILRPPQLKNKQHK
jgi:hypothetical protein